MPLITGVNTITCAILLITSLMKSDTKVITSTSTKPPSENPATQSPSNWINPAFCKAEASAMPPPNNNKIPQAILDVSPHSSNFLPVLLSGPPAGQINNAVAPIIAIIVSSSGIPSGPLNIHSSAVQPNMIDTLISCVLMRPSFANSSLMSRRVCGSELSLFGYKKRVITTYSDNNSNKAIGAQMIIQSKNSIEYPYFSSMSPRKATFGGVPI